MPNHVPSPGVVVARRGAPGAGSVLRKRRVLRQLRIVLLAVKDHFNRVQPGSRLGSAQSWALRVIRDRPGIGVTELARALEVCQPTASNVVRSLTRLALVEVRRGTRDARTVNLFLLPQGVAALGRTRDVLAGTLPQALVRLDADHLSTLEVSLGELIMVLKARRRAERRSSA